MRAHEELRFLEVRCYPETNTLAVGELSCRTIARAVFKATTALGQYVHRPGLCVKTSSSCVSMRLLTYREVSSRGGGWQNRTGMFSKKSDRFGALVDGKMKLKFFGRILNSLAVDFVDRPMCSLAFAILRPPDAVRTRTETSPKLSLDSHNKSSFCSYTSKLRCSLSIDRRLKFQTRRVTIMW
jgi:hypothetical protein